MNRGENAGSLRAVAYFQRLRGYTAAFCKADRSLGWHSVLERLRGGWTLALLAEVRLAIDQGINTHHESPGRASDLHICMMEALILEILFNNTLQLVECLAGEISRQLFGTDLKKKGGSHGVNTTAGDFIGSRFATFK